MSCCRTTGGIICLLQHTSRKSAVGAITQRNEQRRGGAFGVDAVKRRQIIPAEDWIQTRSMKSSPCREHGTFGHVFGSKLPECAHGQRKMFVLAEHAQTAQDGIRSETQPE